MNEDVQRIVAASMAEIEAAHEESRANDPSLRPVPRTTLAPPSYVIGTCPTCKKSVYDTDTDRIIHGIYAVHGGDCYQTYRKVFNIGGNMAARKPSNVQASQGKNDLGGGTR